MDLLRRKKEPRRRMIPRARTRTKRRRLRYLLRRSKVPRKMMVVPKRKKKQLRRMGSKARTRTKRRRLRYLLRKMALPKKSLLPKPPSLPRRLSPRQMRKRQL